MNKPTPAQEANARKNRPRMITSTQTSGLVLRGPAAGGGAP
jgi:hypothetical protein